MGETSETTSGINSSLKSHFADHASGAVRIGPGAEIAAVGDGKLCSAGDSEEWESQEGEDGFHGMAWGTGFKAVMAPGRHTSARE